METSRVRLIGILFRYVRLIEFLVRFRLGASAETEASIRIRICTCRISGGASSRIHDRAAGPSAGCAHFCDDTSSFARTSNSLRRCLGLVYHCLLITPQKIQQIRSRFGQMPDTRPLLANRLPDQVKQLLVYAPPLVRVVRPSRASRVMETILPTIYSWQLWVLFCRCRDEPGIGSMGSRSRSL